MSTDYYQPFSPAWKKEVMKLPKPIIIDMLAKNGLQVIKLEEQVADLQAKLFSLTVNK